MCKALSRVAVIPAKLVVLAALTVGVLVVGAPDGPGDLRLTGVPANNDVLPGIDGTDRLTAGERQDVLTASIRYTWRQPNPRRTQSFEPSA